MPELPEVESLRLSLRPLVIGAKVLKFEAYRKDLRLPIPTEPLKALVGAGLFFAMERRGKYLLWHHDSGQSLIWHLGMSGNIYVQASSAPKWLHTHIVISLETAAGEKIHLHYVDPRRFGLLCLGKTADLSKHRLLKDLGPEPLDPNFELGKWIYGSTRKAKQPLKMWLMDAKKLVGVGNIYANEALHRAGLHPALQAGLLRPAKAELLAKEIKAVLLEAIKVGGTSFKDFRKEDPKPGYFRIALKVYGREGEPCRTCLAPIEQSRMGQRATFFCRRCQPLRPQRSQGAY